MITTIKEHMQRLIQEETKKSKWKSTDWFHDIKLLSIDQRGRVGEHFLRDVFKELNKNVKYIDNAHADWDIEVDGLKIEVKLATLDVNNKFQHEGIKSSESWNMIAFIDVAPNNLYITFMGRNKFVFKESSMTFCLNNEWKNSHYRGKDNSNKRATGAGYKVDFPIKLVIETKTIKDFENNFENEKKLIKKDLK